MFTPEIRATLDAVCGPPTDLHKLGERLGVVEVEWKDLDVDGMVLPNTRGYKVILNSNRARSRFSWAHELGHVIIQSGALDSPQFRGHLAGHKEIEKVCNQLAAEILMPEGPFRQHMEGSPTTLAIVPRLARIFDTSIQSTASRYVEFLPYPAVLTLWKPSSSNPLRLYRAWPYQNHGCRPFLYDFPQGNKAMHVEVNGPYHAFSSAGLVSTNEALFVTSRKRGVETYKWASFPTESMAFGSGGNRCVLSLSYVGERRNNPNALAEEA